MGPKQLAGVMEIVAKQKAAKLGMAWSDEAFAADARGPSRARSSASPTRCTRPAALWDDGIIDPRDTRTVLGFALSAIHSNQVQGTSNFGVFRM